MQIETDHISRYDMATGDDCERKRRYSMHRGTFFHGATIWVKQDISRALWKHSAGWKVVFIALSGHPLLVSHRRHKQFIFCMCLHIRLHVVTAPVHVDGGSISQYRRAPYKALIELRQRPQQGTLGESMLS